MIYFPTYKSPLHYLVDVLQVDVDLAANPPTLKL
jgi:hypothetical protein